MKTYTVIQQLWEESERGWGCRPEGCSLHLTLEDCKEYIADYWKTMPDEDVPDEYDRPCGEPKLVEVGPKTYKKIKESTCGIRRFKWEKIDI